jgi:2-desacetyl-2-hydroxyethyl bacteriochlorophyllide A dehydrogenase
MRAARFDSAARTLSVVDVPTPEPGPGEVLVRVGACGICLSDVHLLDGSLPAPLPVVTPGHEAAGTIERVGPGVPFWQPGARVVLAGGKPCGACFACAGGQFNECANLRIMGFHYDGGWAEYVVVPFGALTAVPDGIPVEQAAILADAVATPYAALVERARLRVGESVGLWGIGGLGTHAVQIARMVGAAPIIAIDPLPAARKRALALGADHAFDPADAETGIGELTGGLDVAVDLVGANSVLAQGARCLGRGGRLLIVGVSTDSIELGPAMRFALAGQSLLGHLGYDKRHLDELVALVAAGRLDVSGSITELLPLSDVGRGVETLTSKAGNPIRLVVTP